MSGTFTLYRFFAADDTLLYIGQTINPGRRMEKHAAEKPWWAQVARVTMTQHADLETLRRAERDAIQAEQPQHNIRMNGSPPPHPPPTRPQCDICANAAATHVHLVPYASPPCEAIAACGTCDPGGYFIPLTEWLDPIEGLEWERHLILTKNEGRQLIGLIAAKVGG